MKTHNPRLSWKNVLCTGILILFIVTVHSVHAEINEANGKIFARVGQDVITVDDYRRELVRTSRNTFYHAKPPENELLAFQRDVADKIINRQLLLQQAISSGITVSEDELERELDKYRQRAQRRGQELDEAGEIWQLLKKRIRQDFLVNAVEEGIKQNITKPNDKMLQSYYESNSASFTEPARFDLSTILLGVAPSAGGEAWEAARAEAAELVEKLRDGADFAELAQIHSSDMSAPNGGNLGYSHKGMFSAPAQEMIEKLEPGEISDPLQVLEGIVIFRVNGRKPERLMRFAQVRDRAMGLWLRDEKDRVWQKYIEDLRSSTNIEIDERYLTLSGKEKTDVEVGAEK